MRKFLYLLFIIIISTFFVVACSSDGEGDVTTDPNEETNDEANDDSSTDQQEENDSGNDNESDQTDEDNSDTGESEETNKNQDSKDESNTDKDSEEGSDTNADEEITEEDAVTIVREELDISAQSETIVEVDHVDDAGDYVVHVYDIVETEEGSHTATYGWYIVDSEDGTVENMME